MKNGPERTDCPSTDTGTTRVHCVRIASMPAHSAKRRNIAQLCDRTWTLLRKTIPATKASRVRFYLTFVGVSMDSVRTNYAQQSRGELRSKPLLVMYGQVCYLLRLLIGFLSEDSVWYRIPFHDLRFRRGSGRSSKRSAIGYLCSQSR